MRLRTPGRIFIPTIMISIIGIIMMISPMNFEAKSGIGGFFSNTFKHFIETFSNPFAVLILLVSFGLLLVINSFNKKIEKISFDRLSPEQQTRYTELSKQNYFVALFNSGKNRQSEEEEAVLALDHGYDGIKELDNALPQWWLAMFYMGIVFMVVYCLAYAFTDFAHQEVEFEKHMAESQVKVDEWIKNNDINIDGAQNKFADPQAIEEGKKIFEQTCATCHTANGGGGIGPNLTDDAWVNKTQDDLFKNIYDIIYNGSPTNAQMRPFGAKGEMTGLSIEKVASYVYYLNQEAPVVSENEGGAAPQGEVVSQWARKK